jgi:hypothetical protein
MSVIYRVMNDDLGQILADAAERIKREYYASGWRDAMAAVAQALSGIPSPAGGEDRGLEFTPAQPSVSQEDLPTQGSTPFYVVTAVRKHPGMTTGELLQAVADQGHNAPEKSVRTSIYRMKDRGFIVARHNKWFPQ